MIGSQHSKDRNHASNPPPVCFNCGVTGHFVVACPQPSRETPAGFDVAHASGLLPCNQQHQHQEVPYQQQYPAYPNQQYSHLSRAFLPPAYGVTSSVCPHPPSDYQSTPYKVCQPSVSLHHSGLSYVSQNHPHGLQSIPMYQASIPDSAHTDSIPNYKAAFPVTHIISQGQWNVKVPSSSNRRSYRSASYSGLKREHAKTSLNQYYQSTRSASMSHCPQGNSVSSKNSKFKFDSLYKSRSTAPSFPDSSNKGNLHDLLAYPRINIEDIESSTQSKTIQELITQRKSYSSEMKYENLDAIGNEYTIQISELDPPKNSDLTHYQEVDDLWNWEYDAAFRDPPKAETVELAQPLAIGFKSTPVPLVQAWSSTLPSVSRYARKDNVKEFTRSIRSSPQWSYMQEDPVFMDVDLGGELVQSVEALAGLTVRYGVDHGSDNTSIVKYAESDSNKRKRQNGSDGDDEQNNVLKPLLKQRRY